MTEKGKPRFTRRDSVRFSRLGKNRKKKQKWKRPTGRDNKMREKRGGYPATVSIGYRTDRIAREKIGNKKMVTVNNMKDLEKVGKNEIAILGSMGKKKKLEIAKKAKESKIEIQNLNANKFIKLNSKKETKKPEKEISKPERTKEEKK